MLLHGSSVLLCEVKQWKMGRREALMRSRIRTFVLYTEDIGMKINLDRAAIWMSFSILILLVAMWK